MPDIYRIPLIISYLAYLGFAPITEAAPSQFVQEKPNEMAPYNVSVAPFGYLGIKKATLAYNFLSFITFKGPKHLRVDELYPDSPGIAAGIEIGDLIISIDGKPIGQWSMFQLKHFAETVEVNQIVKIGILRAQSHDPKTLDVKVTKRPKPRS